MFRSLFVVSALFVTLILPLSACGSVSDEPMNLTGTWSTDQSDASFLMNADVTDDEITITWTSDDMSALYWKGTFAIPEDATEGTPIASEADVEALSESMLGSTETSKIFKVEDGALTFPLGIAGVTKTIRLER